MSRIYRVQDKYVPFVTELLEQHAHDIATKQLIPRIAKENTQALQTVKTPVFYFQRIRVGRRCSCSTVNASASSLCRSCYNTLVVGGYNKYGTNLAVIDVTSPNTRTINVMPQWGEQVQPKPFGLVPGAVTGYLEVRVPLEANIGKLDALMTSSTQMDGLRVFIKAPADTSWVEFSTEQDLEQRLFNPYVDFKFTFTRRTVLSPSPKLSCMYIRYKRKTDCTILTNVPRNENSIILGDLGVVDDWKTKKFWTDNTLRSITTEDFLAETDDTQRWKIISANDFAPEKLLTSWDLDTRLIQPYESMIWVPLGS
jgi:hypothetical protein